MMLLEYVHCTIAIVQLNLHYFILMLEASIVVLITVYTIGRWQFLCSCVYEYIIQIYTYYMYVPGAHLCPMFVAYPHFTIPAS